MTHFEIKLKTHSRQVLEYPNAAPCFIHGDKPEILKIVAGRSKDIHYVAHCKMSDNCNRITTLSADEVVRIWNNYNQKPNK